MASTPFALEQQSEEQQPATWNPWDGPAHPGFFAGLDESPLDAPRTILGAMGSGAAKLELTGGKLVSSMRVDQSELPSWKRTPDTGAAIQQDARERVKALTPDSATTGTAVNLLHGVVEGAYLASTGTLVGGPVGGIATLGTGEGVGRYDELVQQGVDHDTALKLAGVTGVTSGLGALPIFGFGAKIATKMLTGAAVNVGMGIGNRYLDHTILESNGYHDMAEQSKVMDGTQLLIDGILGMGFGGLAHLHAHERVAIEKAREAPGAEDAAMAANLANQDRMSSPGVPTTPEASGLHQAALEKALEDVVSGRPVDVSSITANQEPSQPTIKGFSTSKGSTYEVHEDGTTTRNKAARPEHPGEVGIQPKSESTFYVSKEDADKLGFFQIQGAGKLAVVQDNGMAAVKYLEGNEAGKLERSYLVKTSDKPAIGMLPVELWKNGERVHFGNEITSVEKQTDSGPSFLKRPEPNTKPVSELLLEHLIAGHMLDEEANLRDLENALAVKRGEALPAKSEPTAIKTDYRIDEDGNHVVTSPNGHSIARQRGNSLQEIETETKPTAQGKGEATARAKRLIQEAQNKGLNYISDTKVSDAAVKMYGRLEREGYKVTRNAASPDGEGSMLSDAGKPVFEVQPKSTDIVSQALNEHPDMKLPTPEGNVSAKDALAKVDEQAAQGANEIPKAVEAAVNCFSRKGS